jgi:hypothetical protein
MTKQKLFFVLFTFLTFSTLIAQPSRRVPFVELVNNNDGTYSFQGKLFTGASMLLYPDNKKWQEVDWKNGKIDGEFRSWYATSAKEQEIEYSNGKRKMAKNTAFIRPTIQMVVRIKEYNLKMERKMAI